MGAPVLIEIEQVIAGLPTSALGRTSDLSGLAAVLLIYFRLAAKAKHKNFGSFLMQLPASLREEAARSIFVLWGPASAAQDVAFPSRLLNPVAQLTQTGSSAERSMARRLLAHLIHHPDRGSRHLGRRKPVHGAA